MLGVGIGLGVGEFIGRRPGLAPKLDLNFASTKSLTASKGPTPSFSRASTGSYFDGSGVLRYATLNLCLQSGFASGWSYTAGLTATPNSGVAPDGTNTALKIYATSSGSNKAAIKSDNADCNCVSWYAKSAGKSWTGSMDNPPTGPAAWFNLSTGTVGTVQSGYTASIQSVGNGWYRCCVSKNSGNFYKPDNMVIYVLDSDNSSTITANGTDGILIWGPQAELKSVPSATPGTYVPTTTSANSAPRFNHLFNGTSWVSRGLLVEEQRTNILNYSEDFTNAYWGKSGASVSGDSATAPDGNTTADKFVENAGNTTHVIGRSIGTTSGTQTWSFFAKKAERNWIAVNAYVGADARTWFNLDAGTVGTNAAGSTATIQNVGNGWYRCSVSRTGGASTYFDMHIANSDNSYVYTGDGTSGLFVWGAQLETGAFPTSYIGTTNSSVVRSADVCQITGSDFSGFWNGTEGTFAVECDRISFPSTTSFAFEAYSNASNKILLENDSSADYSSVRNGGVDVVSWVISPAVQPNVSNKSALAYQANDFAWSRLGASPVTDTSGSVPYCNALAIGNRGAYGALYALNGHIARLRYYRKRLPNATLQQLST